MIKRKTTRLAGATAVLAALLAVTACEARDRAGGNAAADVTVLTLAQVGGTIRPAQLTAWADQVERASQGMLRIDFKDEWRREQPDFEVATLRDVREGKVDMAWVGVRALDRVGVTSFQALLAPMLVDSYDLEAKVFQAGIPGEMLAELADVDLVGVGVLPGPIRRVLGVKQPLVRPADFKGKKIAMQDSAVAEMTLAALGATPTPVQGGVELDGLDGHELQLAAIMGNHYAETAKFVTGNINLWPRPLLIVIRKAVYDGLSREQQQILVQAAATMLPTAVESSREEDAEALPNLCRLGMSIPVASVSDLKAMRDAVEPVYQKLRTDPKTARWLENIQSMKQTTGAAPDIATCPSTRPAAGPLDGTWTRTMTKDDFITFPGPTNWTDPPSGTWTLMFKDGVLTKTDPVGRVERWTYEIFRDRIHAEGQFDATFHIDGDRLTFSDFCSDCGGYAVAMAGTKKPWLKTSI